jgi:hypothetical protein
MWGLNQIILKYTWMSDIKIKCELKLKKNIGTIKCENENTKRCFIKLKKSTKWRGRRDLYE